MSPDRVALRRHRHTVLIVGDVEEVREAFATLLLHHGFAAATAGDGADALRQLRAGVRPCLVLLDLRMPGVDGWQVWREMKVHRALAKVPVAIVTRDLAHQQQAHEAGFDEALLKPVAPQRLIAVVEQHCRSKGRR